LINHVKLKHPAESPAESPVKQSSLKSVVDSPKKKEKITTTIADMVIFLNKNNIKVPRNEPYTTD